MDCMAFGMGMCCLQVSVTCDHRDVTCDCHDVTCDYHDVPRDMLLQITFQAWDVNEARDLYDQLAVVSPLFMAISAGTPMVKVCVSDV